MPESLVCMTYPNCDRDHVAGMGGTPIHRTPDMIVVPEISHVRPVEPYVRPGYTPIRPGLLEELAFDQGLTIERDPATGYAYIVTAEGYRYYAAADEVSGR